MTDAFSRQADSGVATWYDFAVAICDEAVALGLLGEGAARVQPIATCDYPTLAKRPAFSVLDTRSTAKALSSLPPHWRHALRKVLKQIGQKL